MLMLTPNSRKMHDSQCHDVVRLVQEVVNIDRRLRLCSHIKFILVSKSGAYQLTKLVSSIDDRWVVTCPCYPASEVVREEAVHLFAPEDPEVSGEDQEPRLILHIVLIEIPVQETFD